MNRRAPEDRGASGEFCRSIRSLVAFDPPFPRGGRLAAALDQARFAATAVSRLPLLLRSSRTTLGEAAARFRNPFLARAIASLSHFGGAEVPLLAILLPLAYADRKATGMPVGGWLALARSIEKRSLDLGGQVRYGARVARIIVEGGHARGVVLADGTGIPADVVISAADGRTTLFDLLGDAWIDEGIRAAYTPDRVSDQPVQVNLGVAQDFTRSFDPSMSPAGKASLTVFWGSDWSWWKAVETDRALYDAEKQKAADAVIRTMEGYHPGFSSRVEVVDVSTPLSSRVRHRISTIADFHMAGQWAEPWGGITTAAQSGRKVLQEIVPAEGRLFVTTIP